MLAHRSKLPRPCLNSLNLLQPQPGAASFTNFCNMQVTIEVTNIVKDTSVADRRTRN